MNIRLTAFERLNIKALKKKKIHQTVAKVCVAGQLQKIKEKM